jgi:hypothetical protein
LLNTLAVTFWAMGLSSTNKIFFGFLGISFKVGEDGMDQINQGNAKAHHHKGRYNHADPIEVFPDLLFHGWHLITGPVV